METTISWLPVGVTPETTSGNQREPRTNKKIFSRRSAFLNKKKRFVIPSLVIKKFVWNNLKER